MLAVLLAIMLLLLLIAAVRVKVGGYRGTLEETAASPVSRALAELTAIAGGIYLSLVLMVNFLKVNLPATIAIGDLIIDPLAVVALMVALVQPLILRVWPWLKGR